MKTWDVTIAETLTRTVPVQAKSVEEAEKLVRDMYDRHEITLGAEDHCDIEIQGEYEGMCPLCGAEIEYDGYHEMDDLGGLFSWGCPQCGAHGEEGYSRKFDGHYHVEKGSKEIQ